MIGPDDESLRGKGKNFPLSVGVFLNGDVSSNVEMRIFLFFLFSVKGENQLCARRNKKEIKKLEKNSNNEPDIIRVGASKVNFLLKFLIFKKCTLEYHILYTFTGQNALHNGHMTFETALYHQKIVKIPN